MADMTPEVPWGRCDGSPTCPADGHVFGCIADHGVDYVCRDFEWCAVCRLRVAEQALTTEKAAREEAERLRDLYEQGRDQYYDESNDADARAGDAMKYANTLLANLNRSDRELVELRRRVAELDAERSRADKAEAERDEARGDQPAGFWSQREWEDWSNELGSCLPEGAECWPGANPEGSQESIIEAALQYLMSQRHEVQRLRDGITALADANRHHGPVWELVRDLRALLGGGDDVR